MVYNGNGSDKLDFDNLYRYYCKGQQMESKQQYKWSNIYIHIGLRNNK